jgi:hypothetical protein
LPKGVRVRRVEDSGLKDVLVCTFREKLLTNEEYLIRLFEEKFDKSLIGLLEGVNCSEFIARILRSGGLLPIETNCSWITPEDLWKLEFEKRVEIF